MILLLYTLMAIISIHCYSSPYASEKFEPELKLFPFLYLWGMIVISILPLLQIKEKQVTHLIIPNKRLVNLISIACIAFCVLHAISILPDLKGGLVMMLADSENALDLYNEATSAKMSSTASTNDGVNVIAILSGQALVFLPLVFFLYLILPKKNVLIFILLCVSLLILPIEGIAKANRQMMALSVLEIFLLFFFFKDYIPPKIISKIRLFFVIILIFLGGVFITITIVRTSVSSDKIDYVIFGIERYFAEGPIIFNDCIDANGTREGNRVFPLLKMIAGKPVLSASEMRTMYSMMKVDSSRFSTYVGDFVLDYGPIISMIIFSLFSFTCCRILRGKRILGIQHLLIIYLIMKLSAGFYQCTLNGIANNISVVIIILLYFYFNYIYKDSKRIIIAREKLLT